MAFFDFLTPNSVPKHARRIANRDAQAEDREASAEWLAKDGSDAALLGLCARFGLQLEHQLKDRKEKDRVAELLTGHGQRGASAARGWARANTAFPYAVKVVEAVEGGSAGLDFLLDLLAGEKVEEEFHTEKKRLLLIALAERRDARIAAGAARFLKDYDEGVRNAAVEAVAAQEGEEGREALLAALLNPKEESTRVRGRLAEIFAQRGWPVGEAGFLAQNLPPGFRLQDGLLLRS